MSDINFSIKVLDSNGRPASNIEVSVYDDANIGGSYDRGYTDRDGWVYLSLNCFGYSFPGKVFVNGYEAGRQRFSDGDSASYYLN